MPLRLDALEPFVVCTAALRDERGARAHAVAGRQVRFVDPLRRASEPFLARLSALDAHAFGAAGTALPSWAAYDCLEIPGAIVGLGAYPARAAALGWPAGPAEEPPTLAGDGGDALVPVAMAMLSPCAEPDDWLVLGLGSALDAAPSDDSVDLGAWALRFALAWLAPRRVSATARWGSPRLAVHARLAGAEVRAALLPAHDHPATCLVRAQVDDALLARLLAPAPEPEDGVPVDPLDRQGLIALQRGIESGRRLELAGLSRAGGGVVAVVRWTGAP